MSSEGTSLSEVVVPDPPDPESLDPLLETWPAGRRIQRCHRSDFGATEFNPRFGEGRFHPFQDLRGRDVPVLYGSNTFHGALSETVFHSVPIRGEERRVRRAKLKTLMVSVLAPRRDLSLVQLHGYGLRRLAISRIQLIETEASHYGRTVRWAQALHACSESVDGLIWVSRQHDTSFALILFGDRVLREHLEVVEKPVALLDGSGFRKVLSAAEMAGITILR